MNSKLKLQIETLEKRFSKNMFRHKNIKWELVYERLLKNEKLVSTILQMEETGGEPDVVEFTKTSDVIFCDCSEQSPAGRRSWCYDDEALQSRKANKPSGSAADYCNSIGAELLTEEQYLKLQTFGSFDTKTSSWLYTPSEVRLKGGAIFGDNRFGRTFIYHNGAESYYAARGCRLTVTLKV
ncbi:MAG: DUF4256 domain-containing protein [Bacteroidetes bacterium]|nr:DUF4256 domain-containing protein [Bacteroidota bacterium]